MLLRQFARGKSAEVSSLAGLRIFLSRIQTILARFQLANHKTLTLPSLTWPGSEADQRRSRDVQRCGKLEVAAE
jgi:hypothetical protein